MLRLKILMIAFKTKRHWKKSFNPKSRVNLQFRNDYLVKKIKSLMKSLKIELVVKGYDNLSSSGPCMLYGNHQDNFDALALIYALKAQTEAKDDWNKVATFIAKHTLQYKKYTRYPLNSLDTFYLDRDDIKKSLETFDKFGKYVKENKTYGVIFPEGTRNREGTIGEFKAGAFKVAKKELLPIVPFTINNSVGAFNLKRKEKLVVEVIFHKKIPANSFASQTTIALADRVRTICLESFKKPQYEFDYSHEVEDIENTRSAIKWHKKQAAKKQKEEKKKMKKQRLENKVANSREKEEEKFLKKQLKKEQKEQEK